MNLTPSQVSNLTLLADFMEGLDDSNFSMRHYRSCGSPSCAFGWACEMPEFKAQGISLYEDYAVHMKNMDRLFGCGSYYYLFRASLHHQIATPQQWAAHCRAFLKENGYEVKPKPDPFKAFMEKVREPVDTEEFHPWRTA